MTNATEELSTAEEIQPNSAFGNNDNPTTSVLNSSIHSNVVSQDSKNMGLVNWLGCLLTGFLVPLILLIVKGDDAYVKAQAKEALNFCISLFLFYIGLWVVAFIFGMIFAPLALIPMLLMGLLSLGFVIICIVGAIKSTSGKIYKIPFNMRLLK